MTLQSTNPNAELLAQEAKVANLLSLAWTEFAKLTRDDAGRQDFLRHINQAQYLVLAGPGIRQLNEANAINQANLQAQADLQAQASQQQVGMMHLGEEAQMPDSDQHVEVEPEVPPTRPRRRTKE